MKPVEEDKSRMPGLFCMIFCCWIHMDGIKCASSPDDFFSKSVSPLPFLWGDSGDLTERILDEPDRGFYIPCQNMPVEDEGADNALAAEMRPPTYSGGNCVAFLCIIQQRCCSQVTPMQMTESHRPFSSIPSSHSCTLFLHVVPEGSSVTTLRPSWANSKSRTFLEVPLGIPGPQQDQPSPAVTADRSVRPILDNNQHVTWNEASLSKAQLGHKW